MKSSSFRSLFMIMLAPLCLWPYTSMASVGISWNPTPPISFILSDPSFVCLTDLNGVSSCSTPWASGKISTLPSGGSAAISTQSDTFSFYLGNNLSGSFKLLLLPAYQESFLPSLDELRGNLMTPQSFIGVTSGGKLDFSAAAGTDYYVMLSGTVRGDTIYSFSVSAVPEPEVNSMIMAGIGLICAVVRRRKRKTSHCSDPMKY